MPLKCKSEQIIWVWPLQTVEAGIKLYIICGIECVQLFWSVSLMHSLSLTLFGFFFLLSVATKPEFGSWTFLAGLDLCQFLAPEPYCREEVAQNSTWKLLIIDRIRITSPTRNARHLSSLYFFYYPDAHTVWGFHPHLTYLVSEPGSTSLMSSKDWKNLERKPSKERLSSISFKECCLLGHIWKAAQCRWAELCPVAKERCHAWAAPCES